MAVIRLERLREYAEVFEQARRAATAVLAAHFEIDPDEVEDRVKVDWRDPAPRRGPLAHFLVEEDGSIRVQADPAALTEAERRKLWGAIGYQAEVAEPDGKPIRAFLTDRSGQEIRDRVERAVEEILEGRAR